MIMVTAEQAWRSAAFERMQDSVHALLGHPALVAALDPSDLYDMQVTAGNAYLPNFRADGTAHAPAEYRYRTDAVAIVPLKAEEYERGQEIVEGVLFPEHIQSIRDTASPLGYDEDYSSQDLFAFAETESDGSDYAAERAEAAVKPVASTVYKKYVDQASGLVVHSQAAQLICYDTAIPALELAKTRLHEDVHTRHFLEDPVFAGELLLSRAASEGEAYALEHNVALALNETAPATSIAADVHGVYSRHSSGYSITAPDRFIRDMIKLGAVTV